MNYSLSSGKENGDSCEETIPFQISQPLFEGSNRGSGIENGDSYLVIMPIP
jgi:hypothetical protein